VRTVSRYALIAALTVGLVGAGTVVFGHPIISSNALNSVQAKGRKVLVIGKFTPGREPGVRRCGPAGGRRVFVVDETTGTTFATNRRTRDNGNYRSRTKRPNHGKFTRGLHTVHTVIPGKVGGGYGQAHPCLDAVSNSLPVRIRGGGDDDD
jgi:hypothetical protein